MRAFRLLLLLLLALLLPLGLPGSRPAAADGPPGARELLEAARRRAGRGEIDAALQLYGRAIQLEPASVDAHFERGRLCATLGREECVRTAFGAVLRLRPGDTAILLRMAEAFRSAGQLQLAVNTYRELLRLDPAHADATLELAAALEEAGEHDEALVTYDGFAQRFASDRRAATAAERSRALRRKADASRSRGPIEVSLVELGTVILVDGSIAGNDLDLDVRFLLDTGASVTFISRELARQLAPLRRHPELRVAQFQTGSGVIQAPLVLLETVRVGEAEAHDVLAAVHDVPGAGRLQAILGLSFLNQFRYTVDVDGGLMLLEPK